jgi:glycosyltransferase involved in cell wall biosynthesis
MRILFALAGLHRVDRGAEVAFISVASELARGGDDVTLIGSGPSRPGALYRYLSAPVLPREKFESFPMLPALRSDTGWEEATFIPGLLRRYRPEEHDVTLTCSYPFTNWALRRSARKRPPHVFVTQNGDWPAICDQGEFRFFSCDGLVCTNRTYFERARYPAALIGNGVDVERFRPGQSERERLGLNCVGPLVLMASAMIASKHVDEGIEAVSRIPGATLVVAGDGPMRAELHRLAERKLPGRFRQLTLAAAEMPALYRSVDVFLHLSRAESFGNVYVEAIACGIPVVAIDSQHTRWIFQNDAFLAPPDQPEALAAHIRTALTVDDLYRERLVSRAQGFSWAEIALLYRKFLEDVVRRKA